MRPERADALQDSQACALLAGGGAGDGTGVAVTVGLDGDGTGRVLTGRGTGRVGGEVVFVGRGRKAGFPMATGATGSGTPKSSATTVAGALLTGPSATTLT